MHLLPEEPLLADLRFNEGIYETFIFEGLVNAPVTEVGDALSHVSLHALPSFGKDLW